MTFADRTAAVVPFGFTERQARFLVTVMLHSGVCLGRQYCAFARIEYGAAVANLFKALESRGFATPQTCAHGRGASFTFITNLSTPRSESPRIGTGDRRPWLELWSV